MRRDACLDNFSLLARLAAIAGAGRGVRGAQAANFSQERLKMSHCTSVVICDLFVSYLGNTIIEMQNENASLHLSPTPIY